MAERSPIDRWIDEQGVLLDPVSFAPHSGDAARIAVIDALFDGAKVVFLGETNHFIHEKVDFRVWWMRRLATRHRLVVGEELGWSDGRDVARYLDDGDETHLDRLATFGDRSHVRADRDDSPIGVLRASFDAYPTALFKAEQIRFYRALRGLGVRRFFGIDIDAPGTGYADVDRLRGPLDALGVPATFWAELARVGGESLTAEADRLATALEILPANHEPAIEGAREDLRSMIETLRYTALAHPAADYEALRPAMAYRESTLKRRAASILRTLANDEVLVLMAHAFHLAKDDRTMHRGAGVGPGGDWVSSLGHHLTQELSLDARSVWLLYGSGTDCQPFPDLPRNANYPNGTLNAQLAKHGQPLVAPVAAAADSALAQDVGIGHMYNLVVPVHLPSQADAIFFVPRVTPLRL